MQLSELLFHVEHKTGASINVDALHPGFYASEHLRLTAEQHIHRGAFCVFAKRHSTRTCEEAKDRSRNIARAGEPFCRDCPFGIRELMWPVMHHDTLAATVYLGYFRGSKWVPKVDGTSYKGDPVPTADPHQWELLREQGAFIAQFIQTGLVIWEDEGYGQGKQKPAAFYRDFALRFIERKYQDNIQLTDLASALRVTPNFLSYRLRLACGKRFSELLTDKRLENAAMQLEFHPERDITEIAFMCGFRDSNYFSTVFRKRFGCPPRTYRERFHQ